MKALYLAIVAIGVLALTGCNTIKGMGEDVESGGEHIQDAADDVKEEM
jgi:predicted small secreted protein